MQRGKNMTDLANNLERLSELRKSGALTEDEFRSAKANLLNLSSSGIDDSATTNFPTTNSEYRKSKVPLLVVCGFGIFASAATGAWYYSAPTALSAAIGEKDANCRASPNAQASLKRVLVAGTTVSEVSEQDGWTKIQSENCWVKSTLITTGKQQDHELHATDIEKAPDPELGPGLYRFDAGSGSTAATIARHILASSDQCVGRRAYGPGTTRVWLDFKDGMASSASITNFGEPMGDNASTGFRRNDLQIKAEDRTIDGGDEFEFYGLIKNTNGDEILLAHPHYGAAPKPPFEELTWQFYCGAENVGSEARQAEFRNAKTMITFEDRD